MDTIIRSGRTLLGIVNDVLDFSKIENDNLVLENISFDILDLFEEIIEQHNLKAIDKNISLEYEPSPDIPKYVFGDPTRLKQILTNLISNAIKFTDSNGIVTLNIDVLSKDDDQVILHFDVIDNGIGIAKENIQRIFNSFEQAEAGITRKFGGSGLGLAITKKLVNALGGNLELESKLGKGSTFSFNIACKIDFSSIEDNLNSTWNMKLGVCCKETACPILREKLVHFSHSFGTIIEDFDRIICKDLDVIFLFYNPDILKRLEFISDNYPDVPIVFVGDISDLNAKEKSFINDTISEPLYKSKIQKLLSRYYYTKIKKYINQEQHHYTGKVLVAEDNPTNKKLIELILMRYGLSPFFASNGEEAIKLYRREDPQLIMMDLHMPIMDGMEAAKQIMQLENNHVPNIIALTADVFRLNTNMLDEIGFSGYLAKPIDNKKLELILDQYLTRVSTQQEQNKEPISDQLTEQSSEMLDANLLTTEKPIDYQYNIGEIARKMFLDESDIIILVNDFYNLLPEHISNITTALNKKDKSELKKALHNLKGASANLRFKEAAKELATMETYASSGEFDKIKLSRLITYFNSVRKKIEMQTNN